MTFFNTIRWIFPFYVCINLMFASVAWSSNAGKEEEDDDGVVLEEGSSSGAGASSLSRRLLPVIFSEDSDFTNPAFIIDVLKKGGLEPENLAEILKQCEPYTDFDKGELFWNAFLLEDMKLMRAGKDFLPLRFLIDLGDFTIDEETGIVSLLNPEKTEIRGEFPLPKTLDGEQRVQSATCYQLLTLAALCGQSKALVLQTNIRMLAHKAGREDLVPYITRMGLSAKGTAIEDFQTWTHVLRTMIVDSHSSEDPNINRAYQLNFCDLLNLRCEEGWLNQLSQHFGGVDEPLTYDQAMSVMTAATELGNALNGFVAGLVGLYNDDMFPTWSAEKHPPSIAHMRKTVIKAGKVLIDVKHSVDQFLQATQLRSVPGAAMTLTGVGADSIEELELYDARYKAYNAFAADFLFNQMYLATLKLDGEAMAYYEMYIKTLWVDLTAMGIGYLTHAQNQTTDAENMLLDLPKEDMEPPLRRKATFLGEFVGYMDLAKKWSEERHAFHVDVVQRATQDALFWDTSHKALDEQAAAYQPLVVALVERDEKAVKDLKFFQDEINTPFLKELKFARGLRDFAPSLLQAAMAPDVKDQHAAEFVVLIRKHFEKQGADEEKMTYVKALESAAESFEGSAIDFMTDFLGQQESKIEEFLATGRAHTKENARLMAEVFTTTTLVKAGRENMKTLLKEAEKARQEMIESNSLIENNNLKRELFLGEMESYAGTYATLGAALARIQKELAAL